jgi:hypothetical protein
MHIPAHFSTGIRQTLSKLTARRHGFYGFICVRQLSTRNPLNNTRYLISGFHRALLQSVTFISQLMHSVIQNVDVKMYVV